MAAGAGKKTFTGEIFIDARPVTWIRNGSLRQRPVYLFAHGAGAPQTSAFMEEVATGLAARGICVVRFHFPYMERVVREGKRRPPDAAQRLLQTCSHMLQFVTEQLPARQRDKPPVVVGGKSMGGRMLSMLVAQGVPDDDVASASRVAGLVYFGYPLHPPGQPTKLRTAHLADIRVPQLFVSGSRDALARLDILENSLRSLGRRAHLHVVEGGDHSLATNRKEPLRGSDAWLDVAAAFMERQCKSRLA